MSLPLDSDIQFREPLAQHTSARVGGPATVLVRPASVAAIGEVWRFAEQEGLPVVALGEGTAVLARDAGFLGVVVQVTGVLGQVMITGKTVQVGAGARLQDCVRAAAAAGLAGLEEFAGIPGTVAGAVVSDVTAPSGARLRQRVRLVKAVTPTGLVEVGVEAVATLRGIVTGVSFRLAEGDAKALEHRMKQVRRQLRVLYPLWLPGVSVWEDGDVTRRLVTAVGCLGKRRGGMEISVKTPWFLVNRGAGTAAEALALMHEAEQRVRQQNGAADGLRRRVRIL